MAGGVLIDGSRNVDGREVVRTSLTLSLLTGRPFRLVRIRADRPDSGLTKSLLACIHAAARVSDARLGSAEEGSTDLFFQPRGIRPGEYNESLGPGQPCAHLLQTLALPLSMADGPSRLRILGATHVGGAPTLDHLQNDWLPALDRMGVSIRLQAEQLAFGPGGEGRLLALIRGGARPQPREMLVRANLQALSGRVLVAGVPRELGNRMAREARRQLRRAGVSVRVDLEVAEANGVGMVAHLEAVLEGGDRVGFTTLGDSGTSAERAARRLANSLFDWLDTGAAVPPPLADQLLVPLAVAVARGPSVYTTSRVTRRLLTSAAVIREFLPIRIEILGEENEPGEVRISR